MRSPQSFYLGQVAYWLWSTYGLPLEITKDICREHGFDVDEKGYLAARDIHRKKSRKQNANPVSEPSMHKSS